VAGKKKETTTEGGEDHITEFEKQLERLETIVLNAEFDNGSLMGSVRDAMLDVFRNRPKPWSQMSEQEQRDMGKALENVATTLIRRVVLVVAEEDEIAVTGTLKGYSAKGGDFKLTVEAAGDDETALELYKMDGHAVVIMSADAAKFLKKNKDADVEPDQPALEFADEETPPAEEVDLENPPPVDEPPTTEPEVPAPSESEAPAETEEA
jgi:hypothetical protein